MSEVELRFKVQEHQVIPAGSWRIAILYGGRGLGKTWNETRWLITKALSYPNTNWIAVTQTWTDVQDILIDGPGGFMWHIMGDPDNNQGLGTRPSFEWVLLGGKADSHSVPASKGSQKIRFANGSIIHFASAANPDSLRGPNLNGGICDEVAFWDEKSFNTLFMGIRAPLPDGSPPQMVLATTPNGQNWFADRFISIDEPQHGVVYVGSHDPLMPPNPPPSTYTNRFIDETFRSGLEQMFAGTDMYLQEVMGSVLSLKGQIYKGLSPLLHTRAGRTDPKSEHLVTWPTPETSDQIIAGQDLGTEHPSALIILARLGATWFAVEEVVRPAATEDDWYTMIAPTLAKWNPEVIYSDVNFPQTTNAQRRRGLRVKDAEKGTGSVMDGIREVQSLLSSRNLIVDTDACPMLWREFAQYRWALDAKGDPLEKPVKKFDDALDALRYPLYMIRSHPKRRARFAGRAALEASLAGEDQLIQGKPPTLTVGVV